jgi:hypothetical protein
LKEALGTRGEAEEKWQIRQRSDEVAKWQSGKVAKWQSEGQIFTDLKAGQWHGTPHTECGGTRKDQVGRSLRKVAV